MENSYFIVKGNAKVLTCGFYHSCSNLGVFATKGAVRVLPPFFFFTLGSVSGTNQSGGFWSDGYVSCLFAPF